MYISYSLPFPIVDPKDKKASQQPVGLTRLGSHHPGHIDLNHPFGECNRESAECRYLYNGGPDMCLEEELVEDIADDSDLIPMGTRSEVNVAFASTS